MTEQLLPFFEEGPTIEAIAELGKMRNLSIFAGAGVSIDRVGFGWSNLIVEILMQTVKDAELAKSLVRNLGPTSAASAIFPFEDSYSGDYSRAVREAVQNALYRNREVNRARMGGEISTRLVEVALEAATRDGRAELLTTNYDEFLIEDLRRACNNPGLEIAQVDFQIKETRRRRHVVRRAESEKVGIVECVYLHGFVPRDGECNSSPILSEPEYLKSRDRVEQRLRDSFEERDVLIVGSSLQDQPLLAALMRTKEAAQDKGLRRFAILPYKTLGTDRFESRAERKRYLELISGRLGQLGVKGIYPHFFSQISQTLTEMRIAYAQAEASIGYATSAKQYGKRLEGWWRDWSADLDRDLDKRQDDDYQRLLRELGPLREKLNCGIDEEIKAEVWLRWNPSTTHRVLRLWASTFSRFTSYRSTRTAEIDISESNSAAIAFREGRTVHLPDEDLAPGLVDGSHRWQSYIAAPLIMPEYQLPVGAIVLASMSPPDSSGSLGRDRMERQNVALKYLEQAALDIARRPLVP